MAYALEYTKAAEKCLRRLPPKLAGRIKGKLRALAQAPYAPNNNVKRLVDDDALYRLRVGDWRVFYMLEDARLVVIVLDIEARGSAYKP